MEEWAQAHHIEDLLPALVIQGYTTLEVLALCSDAELVEYFPRMGDRRRAQLALKALQSFPSPLDKDLPSSSSEQDREHDPEAFLKQAEQESDEEMPGLAEQSSSEDERKDAVQNEEQEPIDTSTSNKSVSEENATIKPASNTFKQAAAPSTIQPTVTLGGGQNSKELFPPHHAENALDSEDDSEFTNLKASNASKKSEKDSKPW